MRDARGSHQNTLTPLVLQGGVVGEWGGDWGMEGGGGTQEGLDASVPRLTKEILGENTATDCENATSNEK